MRKKEIGERREGEKLQCKKKKEEEGRSPERRTKNEEGNGKNK